MAFNALKNDSFPFLFTFYFIFFIFKKIAKYNKSKLELNIVSTCCKFCSITIQQGHHHTLCKYIFQKMLWYIFRNSSFLKYKILLGNISYLIEKGRDFLNGFRVGLYIEGLFYKYTKSLILLFKSVKLKL